MAAPIEAALQAKYEAAARAAEEQVETQKRDLARQAADLAKQKGALDELVAARLSAERAKLSEAAEAKAREAVKLEFKAVQDEAAESRRKLTEATKRELELGRRERELADKENELQLQMQAKLDVERAKITERAKAEAEQQQSGLLKTLQAELAEKAEALKGAQEAELAIRRERNKLEEEKRDLALTLQRQLDAERDQIRAAALKQADEEHRLKLAESEKKLADVSKQLEEARRKAEQGSQQSQGEVLEIELEQMLRSAFPLDLIEPVPKGVHGGDVLQRVRNDIGQVCGTILWESKSTKAWSDGWLPKLRDNGRSAKADAFALMTMTLPKDVCNFGNVNGVWITNRDCVLGVAAALRATIIEVAASKRALEGQHGKMELVYHYLTGPQFRQRVEAVVEVFSTMQSDLEAERRAIRRLWEKREKQIERAALNAVGMHGDLAGIVGTALPEIEGMAIERVGDRPLLREGTDE
jgi:hypothetical protein